MTVSGRSLKVRQQGFSSSTRLWRARLEARAGGNEGPIANTFADRSWPGMECCLGIDISEDSAMRFLRPRDHASRANLVTRRAACVAAALVAMDLVEIGVLPLAGQCYGA